MFARHLRWAVDLALARGGDDDRAREHLGRVDPLLRGGARRQLQRHVEAILEADPQSATGRPMLEEIARRVGADGTAASERAPLWWPTMLCAVVVAAVVAFAALRIGTASSSPPAAEFDPAAAPPMAESRDAYEHGGRPLSLGERGDEVFGAMVLNLVLALDRDARGGGGGSSPDVAAAEAALLSAEVRALVGDAVHAALEGVVAACKATTIDGARVTGDVDELNAALQSAGLGYYVDDDVLRHDAGTTPLLYAHRVERVLVYDIAGAEPQRVLWLRRLDRLNLRTTAVGSTHDGAGAAVIRLDLVDSELLSRFLPALEPGSRYRLWPLRPSERLSPRKREVEETAGEMLRRDLHGVGVVPEDGARMAELLAARADRFAQLESEASRAGLRIAIPGGYRVDVAPYRRLEDATGAYIHHDLDAIDAIDAELGSPKMAAVYRAARRAYVGAVGFHEIQHRLDRERVERVPPGLERYVGVQPADGSTAFSRRLVTEYSAYLAEIAHSDIPFAALVRLSHNAFDTRAWSTTYAETSVGVIDSLATVAGIDHGELVTDRAIDRDELGRVLVALLSLPRPALQAAARGAWERDFESELPTPTLRDAP